MGYCVLGFVLPLFLQAISKVVGSELRDFIKHWSSKSAVSGAHMLRYLQGFLYIDEKMGGFILYIFLFLLPQSLRMKSPIFFHFPPWLELHLDADRLMQNSLAICRWSSMSQSLCLCSCSFASPPIIRSHFPYYTLKLSTMNWHPLLFFCLLTGSQNTLSLLSLKLSTVLINCTVSTVTVLCTYQGLVLQYLAFYYWCLPVISE